MPISGLHTAFSASCYRDASVPSGADEPCLVVLATHVLG